MPDPGTRLVGSPTLLGRNHLTIDMGMLLLVEIDRRKDDQIDNLDNAVQIWLLQRHEEFTEQHIEGYVLYAIRNRQKRLSRRAEWHSSKPHPTRNRWQGQFYALAPWASQMSLCNIPSAGM